MGNCSTEISQPRFSLRSIPTINENSSKITSKYRIVNLMKSKLADKFVYNCVDVLTKESWIMKKYLIGNRLEERVFNEIEIHKAIQSINVVKIHEFFKTDDCVMMVFEKAPGKKLFNALSSDSELDVGEFETIFHQLVSFVSYLHRNMITLRSIDPSNIYYDGQTIKFINIDNASFFKKNQKFKDRLGPAMYMSPEMVNGKYTSKTDVWAVGMIAYILLTGASPYLGESSEEIMLDIKNKNLDYALLDAVEIQDSIKSLIKDMLSFDPKSRPKFKNIQESVWYKTFVKRSSGFHRKSLFTKRLKEFNFRNKFIRTIHSYLVRNAVTSNEKELALREFKKLDVKNEGCLNLEEFEVVLVRLGFENPQEITKELFEKLDVNKNGLIDYQQFLDLWIDRETFFEKANLQKYFNILDRDKNGVITREDLENVFGDKTKSHSFNKYFKKYSKVNSMDFSNFEKMIRDLKPVMQSSRDLDLGRE
jgi:calcium-dependent protein kinase